MKMYMCEMCGAECREVKPPICPICRHKDASFYEDEVPDPDPAEIESSKKYEEVLKTLDEYEEGCEPQSMKYAFEE